MWHRRRTTQSRNRLWVVNGDSVTSCLISSLLSISCPQRKCPCCLNYKLFPGLWHLTQGRPPGRQDEATYGGKRQTYDELIFHRNDLWSSSFTAIHDIRPRSNAKKTSSHFAYYCTCGVARTKICSGSSLVPILQFLFIYPGLQGNRFAKLTIQKTL